MNDIEKDIVTALDTLATAYNAAAHEACKSRNPYEVYRHMKDFMTASGKARRMRQNLAYRQEAF